MPLTAEQQRNHQTGARADAKPADPMRVKPHASGLILQAQRLSRPQRGARHAVIEVDPSVDQPRRQLPGDCGDHHLPAVLMLDHQRPSGYQRPPALGHKLQNLVQVGLTPQRPSDLQRCLERIHRAPQIGVTRLQTRIAPGVVNRHARELRQHLNRLLIVLGELLAAGLLGQVQIPERPPIHDHRNPQKRLHRRMLRRKTIGTRMRTHIRQTQRHRTLDQLPQHPPAARQRTDPPTRVLINPDRNEPLKLIPRLIQHPERHIPRTRHLPRGLNHPLEDRVEIEVGNNPPGDLKQPTQVRARREFAFTHRGHLPPQTGSSAHLARLRAHPLHTDPTPGVPDEPEAQQSPAEAR
jgi:hypothetical protein